MIDSFVCYSKWDCATGYRVYQDPIKTHHAQSIYLLSNIHLDLAEP